MNAKQSAQFDLEQLHFMQEKLALFIRHLAVERFHIDIESQVIAQQLLATNDFSDRQHMQHSLRTLLCKNAQQWRAFDQLYSDFWLRKPKMAQVKRSPQPTKSVINATEESDSNSAGSKSSESNNTPSNSSASESRADVASAKDVNEPIDFAFLDDNALLQHFSASCRQLAKSLARKLRKTVRSPKKEQIDLRQSIQRNLKNGGNLIELVWLNKPKVLPHFTLLIDVSRSMSGYSDAFLIFALAMIKELPETRVFIFNTKLIDISTALRDNRLEKIKQQLKLLSNTWGGGTRIAHSIAELRKRGLPSKRSNHHFIIHSDGLDTDPATSLTRQLRSLQKQYRSIIWLSPLLKDANYQVETAALKSALPYIDKLLPVHNLNCLYELTNIMSASSSKLSTSKTSTSEMRASQNSVRGVSYAN